MLKLIKNLAIFTGIAVLMMFAFSCSTKKNTLTSRFYHNTTLRYNVYFNGNEAYKRGINRINSQNVDNYSEMLPVFVDSKESLASTAGGDMDKAIQKASKGIKHHSITKKPKMNARNKKEQEYLQQNEFVKWIDDCYLLMGKAYFIKRDYIQAKLNFEYIIRQYSYSELKYISSVYIARCYIEQNNFKLAKEAIDNIEGQKDFPDKCLGIFNTVYADYLLRQKKYEEAIPKLQKTIELTKNRQNRLRYIYILAQIEQKLAHYDKASELYKKVIKRNKIYEMEFNARINLAKCYGQLGKDTKDIRKKLAKMLKDDKNIEYKDQIYYALAEIDYNSSKVDEAIVNYKKSSESSVSNDYQKGLSCLKLGDIYFSRLDYRNSQIYYDSCIQFLPATYENYSKIRSNSQSLNELIGYIDVVEFQDSVQKLAKMSEKDRNAIIDKIIKDLNEQERIDRELAQQEAMNSMIFDQRRGSTQGNQAPVGTGKWYFYNPAQLSFGKNEFAKKWGNRKNEDNWRRKTKTTVNIFEDYDNDENDNELASKDPNRESNPKNRNYYLQDIPLSDSALVASNQKIIEALFNIGRIYKDKFNDYGKSISAYETLNSRYPDNEYLLLSYYNLYLLNKLLNNDAEAEKYKNLIISKYPDTNYAKLLQNPNFIKELEQQQREVELLYIKTYDSFMDGNCNAVISNTNKLYEDYPNNELTPKFEFFKILCIGKNSDTTAFKTSLVEFMQKYKEDELSTVAQKILAYFGSTDIQSIIAELQTRPTVERKDEEVSTSSISNTSSTNNENSYTTSQNTDYYYAIYFKSKDIDINRLNFKIREFNIFNFATRTFNIVNQPLNNDYEIITVRSFANQRQANNYSKMINSNNDIFSQVANAEYKTFIISVENFKQLQQKKNINEYLRFYKENE